MTMDEREKQIRQRREEGLYAPAALDDIDYLLTKMTQRAEQLERAVTCMYECLGTFATYLYPNHPSSPDWDAPTLCRRNIEEIRTLLPMRPK